MRIVIRCDIADQVRIEDHQIGPGPRAHDPPALKVQAGCGEHRHLAHRLLKAEETDLADVAAEHPRERAVRARVRPTQRQRAVRRVRPRVASDADPRLCHDEANVPLVHRVMDDIHSPLVEDERLCRPAQRILAGGAGEIGHGTPRPVGPLPRAGDDDPLPGPAGLGLLRGDPAQDHRICEAKAHRGRPSLVDPVRDDDRKPRRGGGIRVLVCRDVLSLGTGSFDECRRPLHEAPVPLPRRLMVRELHPDTRAPADLEILFDRLEESRPLIPDMARIEAVQRPDLGAKARELRGVGERARRIDESRGKAHCSLEECLPEQLPHRRELLPAGRTRDRAHDRGPQRPVADERADVDRRARPLDGVRVLREGRPRTNQV